MRVCDDDEHDDGDDDDNSAVAGAGAVGAVAIAADDDDTDAAVAVASAAAVGGGDACNFAVHAKMFASTMFGSNTLWLNSCITYVGIVAMSVRALLLVSFVPLLLSSSEGVSSFPIAPSFVFPVWITK